MHSLSKSGVAARLTAPVSFRAAVMHRRNLQALALSAACFLMPNQAFAHAEQAQAAIKNVVDFDATTWAPLLAKGPRPAAYVFTNTFCSTCPEAFEVLHKRIQGITKPVTLAAVVMDVQGNQALAHAHHYTGVTQIYAFDGFEPEIRQTVDPKWRNVTPYIVLISRTGTVQRVIGPPSGAQLKAWLQ